MTEVPHRVDNLGTLLQTDGELTITETTNPNGNKMYEFKLMRKNFDDVRELIDNEQDNIMMKDELMRERIIENTMNIKFGENRYTTPITI